MEFISAHFKKHEASSFTVTILLHNVVYVVRLILIIELISLAVLEVAWLCHT